jgi:hypothetical protein
MRFLANCSSVLGIRGTCRLATISSRCLSLVFCLKGWLCVWFKSLNSAQTTWSYAARALNSENNGQQLLKQQWQQVISYRQVLVQSSHQSLHPSNSSYWIGQDNSSFPPSQPTPSRPPSQGVREQAGQPRSRVLTRCCRPSLGPIS